MLTLLECESSNKLSSQLSNNLTWILDNGASNHMTGRFDLMRDSSFSVCLANGAKTAMTMHGSSSIE